MKRMLGLVGALMVAASAGWAEMRDLEGSVSYRERIAMPEGALVEVSLQDISLADAPSVELASVVIRPAGQVPVDYRLAYDSGMLRDGHRYAVQATTTLDGEVAWRTTQVFPALTADAPARVNVMLERAQRFEFSASDMPEQLTDSSYLVVAINGETVGTVRVPQMTFQADGSVNGTSGCNRFNGTVEVDGSAMTFGPSASTRMACPGELDALEKAFFDALGRVQGYRMENGVTMVDADGDEVLRLLAE